MVRIFQKKDINRIANIIIGFFNFQKHFTHIIPVNYPDVGPCIYAMWHNQQFCAYGLPDKTHINIMISKSKDGEVVAGATEQVFGFKTVRGSKGREGAIEATKQMIEALKNGEYGVITVDGPRGPVHEVKDGVIKIAKIAGVPIVPVVWYSDNFNFIKLPSWDKMEVPIFDVRLINLYGEPIYVPADNDGDSDEKLRLKLQESMLDLLEKAPDEYKKVYWHGLWRRRTK